MMDNKLFTPSDPTIIQDTGPVQSKYILLQLLPTLHM